MLHPLVGSVTPIPKIQLRAPDFRFTFEITLQKIKCSVFIAVELCLAGKRCELSFL